MKVKSLRVHQNQFGENFSKTEGEVYLHPRPEGDIASKVVEKAADDAPLTQRRPKPEKSAEPVDEKTGNTQKPVSATAKK